MLALIAPTDPHSPRRPGVPTGLARRWQVRLGRTSHGCAAGVMTTEVESQSDLVAALLSEAACTTAASKSPEPLPTLPEHRPERRPPVFEEHDVQTRGSITLPDRISGRMIERRPVTQAKKSPRKKSTAWATTSGL
ncbi:hypothetical protein LNAOJCKE_3634 [Methylorubrum aminovorans]|uniref:Transposase n=1 Tax=Methylorubrum aminovorans TaxID=269069 RepID=A0ABQ4UGG1_9HYPH|nr:hypothetical protein [Methylorubrum aminovorans]GJE66415.1 hypothetical protein LNAOJCKE_3634 [Methylorubrum aminovorans]